MKSSRREIQHHPGEALRDTIFLVAGAERGYRQSNWIRSLQLAMSGMPFWAGGFGVEGVLAPELVGEGHMRAQSSHFRQRVMNLIYGVLDGLALTLPMIVMTLVPSVASVLTLASVFVLAFGVVTGLVRGLNPQEVLAVTAGYAAVLVVFGGKSTSR